MTREDANYYLKSSGFSDEQIDTIAKAYTEPCEDAINRQAVCKIRDDIRDCISIEGYWAILERLKKLPPVNPKPKTGWIPVSERLPDLWDERYLVSLAWGGVGVMEYKSTGFHNYD